MEQSKPSYEALEARLAEAENTLKAIRDQKIDAFVGRDGVYLLRLKEMEAALRESEARFRFLINAIPHMVWTANPDGTTEYGNERTLCYLDLDADRFEGWSWTGVIHPDDRPAVIEACRRSLETGEGHRIGMRIRNGKTGEYRWHVTHAVPRRDEAGRIIHWYGTSTDIHDIKQAELAVRQSETRFRTVVEHSSDGIHQVDLRTGRYVFMNPAQERLTGFKREELNLSTEEASERLHPDDRASVERYLARVTAGEEPEDGMEYRWRVKNGEYRWFSDTRRAIFDENGDAVALVGVSRDITDRKRLLESLERSKTELERKVAERTADLESRNRQLRELTRHTIEAMESDRKALSKELHDSIGGSLAGIKMLLETLSLYTEQHLPDGVMPLERIIEHLADTIKESKRISYQMRSAALEDAGLKAAVGDAVKKFKAFYPAVSVDTRVDIADDLVSDETKAVLYRVLQEALNNVGKHSKGDWVGISLIQNEAGILLRVEDNGQGFDVRQALREDGPLQGYGMRSMKERLEICEGVFHIESTPGEGTIVSATIPQSAPRSNDELPDAGKGGPLPFSGAERENQKRGA